MTTYTWDFDRLDVYLTYQTVSKAVFSMYWKLTAADGARTVVARGTQACGPIDPANFTPYELLTKAQVRGWLEAAMSAEDIAQLKAGLDWQLARQTGPLTSALSPPWS